MTSLLMLAWTLSFSSGITSLLNLVSTFAIFSLFKMNIPNTARESKSLKPSKRVLG